MYGGRTKNDLKRQVFRKNPRFFCLSLLFGPTNFRHGVGVATGQESPETQRRLLGNPRGNPTPSRSGNGTDNQSSKSTTKSPLATGVRADGRPQLRIFSPSPSSRVGKCKDEDVENVVSKEEKGIQMKSPALLQPNKYPLVALSPPSSPSRLAILA